MVEEVCAHGKWTAGSASFLRGLSQDGGGGAAADEGRHSKKQDKRGKGRRDRRSERKEDEAEDGARVIPFMSRPQVAKQARTVTDGMSTSAC